MPLTDVEASNNDSGLVERLGIALHDRLYRGSWRSWPDLETDERGEYLHAARGVLDVLAAEGRLCDPARPLPRPVCGARILTPMHPRVSHECALDAGHRGEHSSVRST